MASPGSIVIQFRANADKAVKDIKKLTRSLDDVGDKARGTGRKMKKGLAVGAAAAGAAMLGAGAALVDFGERAIADAAASKRLETALKNTTKATDAQVDAVEDWITQQGIALGVADDDLRPALARLARSTQDVTKAQELAGIAMDIAAATGRPLGTVADALAKAYDGNTGALKRMGIVLDEGPGKWKTLADSVKGSADSQASTIEGTWTRIKLIFSEGAESLGGVVLAPLERLAEWFKDPKHVAEAQTFLDNIGAAAYKAGEDFVTWVDSTLMPALTSVGDWFRSPEGQDAIKTWGGYLVGLGDAMDYVATKAGPLLDTLNTIKKYTDWIPTNILLRAMSGEFNPDTQTNNSGRGGDPSRRPRPTSLPKPTGGINSREARGVPVRNVTVNVINPKPETAFDSAAMALRVDRAM